MVEAGVPPALVDAVDNLKEAVIAGRTDIFRNLLDACEKCDGGGVSERIQLINSQIYENGGTFLHLATKLGRGDIIRTLLAAGADPGVQTTDGYTPLEFISSPAITSIYVEDMLKATAQSRIGRVCQLLAAGLSVNSHDTPLSRNTPLHWAASFGDLDTLQCLIDRGADVNATNCDGATPLHDAVQRGDAEIVSALLENGASPHALCEKGNKRGLTPYQMANDIPHLKDVMEGFMSTGHRPSQNGCNSGSISPVLARRSLFDGQGSLDSLTSVGSDNLATCNTPIGSDVVFKHSHIPNGYPEKIGVQSKTFNRTSSCFDLSPSMEQLCERLSSVHLRKPVKALVTNSVLHHLWPQPREIVEYSGPKWKPCSEVLLGIVPGQFSIHDVIDVWDSHKTWFVDIGIDIQLGGVISSSQCLPEKFRILCHVDPRLVSSSDEYTINIKETVLHIKCGSLESLHTSLVTLVQLLRLFRSSLCPEEKAERRWGLPQLFISDYPSVKNRGFMLDMAPLARIPKFEKLCHIVDSLLYLKYNQLHLMLRLASDNTPGGGCICYLPYAPSEIITLERYCHDRGISLVPAFDIDALSSSHTFSAIAQSVSSAMNNFPSANLVHIGPSLTAFLLSVQSLEKQPCFCPWDQLGIPSGAILMVCANVFHEDNRKLSYLPSTTILVEYGFQADYNFSKGTELARHEGFPFYVCPGTAAWNSLSGWPEAGVSNVYMGAHCAKEGPVSGVLVAHWSSTSSLTPLVFMWPSLVVASGLAWNHHMHWDYVNSSLGSLIDTHLVCVPNCGIGTAILEMGRCESWITRVVRGQDPDDPSEMPSSSPGSALHQLLADPDSLVVENLTLDIFSNLIRHVKGVMRSTSSLEGIGVVARESSWPLIGLATLELHLAMDMILTACRLGRALIMTGTNPNIGKSTGFPVVNPGVINLPPTSRTDLANKMLALREVYSSVWHQGQCPPGLQASLLILTSLLARLLPDQNLHCIE